MKGVFILYAFLNLFLWPSLAFFTFYKGYYGLCQAPNAASCFRWFICAQITSVLFWTIFMFIGSGSFNGVAKMVTLSECGLGFSIFLAVVEMCLYLTCVILGCLSLVQARRLQG